ncbi:MAG: Type II secretion system protein G [Burkholderia plantarii]|nr:MAG: Type II secretion system protein G [Burkholderia plantarii]
MWRTRIGRQLARRRRTAGFTLIELLVVLSIIATLTALVAPGYLKQADRAKETVLRHNLNTLRESIDDFRADRGQDPESLEGLVEQRYLRELPLDPVTGKRDSWVALTGDGPGVHDVRSGAKGSALDGSAYDTW